MQIEAGSNNGNPPNIHENEDIDMGKVFLCYNDSISCRTFKFQLIAVGSGMVSSVIFQVPNQPIYFFDDWWIENGQSKGRKEDQVSSDVFQPLILRFSFVRIHGDSS